MMALADEYSAVAGNMHQQLYGDYTWVQEGVCACMGGDE